MSISPVMSSGGRGPDSTKMATLLASKMMSDLDPGQTGKVTKDQFVTGSKAQGVSATDAVKMFDAIDTKKTGSITQSDIEAAIQNGSLKPPPPGGPRGPGGPGGPSGTRGSGGPAGPTVLAKPGATGGAVGPGGTAGSSTETYASKGTDQDSLASGQAQDVYDLKPPPGGPRGPGGPGPAEKPGMSGGSGGPGPAAKPGASGGAVGASTGPASNYVTFSKNKDGLVSGQERTTTEVARTVAASTDSTKLGPPKLGHRIDRMI